MIEQEKFRGFHSPNYTQVPDELFDELLPLLSGAELKVLLYIARRTFGFKKATDNISLSQITDGIVTAAGKRLDGGTGLVKSTAALAVKGLVEKNIIVKVRNQAPRRGDMATTYALNLITAPVQKATPTVSENQTPPGQEIGHPVGRKSDTQETVTKKQNNEVVTVTANDLESNREGTGRRISDRALRSKYGLTDDQVGRVHWLVDKQIATLGAGDRNHAHYVQRAAHAVKDGEDKFLDQELGEFKQAASQIAVGSRPAYFHAMWTEQVQQRHAIAGRASLPQTPAPTDEPENLAQLFARRTDDHPDSRRRMIADAETRGFTIPDYIRTADDNVVSLWWAALADQPERPA